MSRPDERSSELNDGHEIDRPYVTPADTGAKAIVKAIDAERPEAYVPFLPRGPMSLLIRTAPGAHAQTDVDLPRFSTDRQSRGRGSVAELPENPAPGTAATPSSPFPNPPEIQLTSRISHDTDVLIVGSGPAGSAAALLLATYGIKTTLVSKYGWTANTPRAHLNNQRTMEILRELGLEDEARLYGTPHQLLGDTVLCSTLAGKEIARIRTWGTGPQHRTAQALASPTEYMDIPQTYLEPLLITNALKRGATVRFDTELTGFEQDDEGVTAVLHDRVRGDDYQVRARYMIGADGAKSLVASDLGLPFAGGEGKGGSLNILFNADLSSHVAHRPSLLYFMMRPDSHIGGIGMGVLRMIRPWNEWMVISGYDVDQSPPHYSDEDLRHIVHDILGDPSIPIEITSANLWTVNHIHATRYSAGRVFIAGDAAHRHPPPNALGSNTSVQDSYNLAWKLAMVIRGEAGPELLETYTAERAPVGKQIVDRANQSRIEFGGIFQALDIVGGSDSDGIEAAISALRSPDGNGTARRRALEQALQVKNYEFNTHGVELNQRYASSAVIDDGSGPETWQHDQQLFHQPTTRPGAKLPHTWVVARSGEKTSTLDLVGRGKFTLVTGPAGTAWSKAVQRCQEQLSVPVRLVTIGSEDVQDSYGDWARLCEITESGALLIRPDGYIAARWQSAAGDAQELTKIVSSVLSRP